jgi:hypothetical protein
MSRLSVALHIGRVEARMQKVIAVFLASLLLFPAGSFAQDSKVNDGSKIGQSSVVAASTGTLRESAIRQARLAVLRGPQAANPPSWSSRHPISSSVLLGTVVGAAAGGILLAIYSKDSDEEGWVMVGVFGGAVYGALGGLVVGLIRAH